MTDNEIIKALECCSKDDCDNCPNSFANCYSNLAGHALDLIKRYKAENSNLTSDLTSLQNDLTSAKSEIWALKETLAGRLSASASFIAKTAEAKGKAMVHSLKAEAIKEFAERLKEKATEYMHGGEVDVFDINNLVKEMTGEK